MLCDASTKIMCRKRYKLLFLSHVVPTRERTEPCITKTGYITSHRDSSQHTDGQLQETKWMLLRAIHIWFSVYFNLHFMSTLDPSMGFSLNVLSMQGFNLMAMLKSIIKQHWPALLNPSLSNIDRVISNIYSFVWVDFRYVKLISSYPVVHKKSKWRAKILTLVFAWDLLLLNKMVVSALCSATGGPVFGLNLSFTAFLTTPVRNRRDKHYFWLSVVGQFLELGCFWCCYDNSDNSEAEQ